MKYSLIFLFIVSIFSFSCSAKDYVVEHKTEYSYKGSRSEARHGYIFVDGKKLPDYFRKIIIHGVCYRFYQRKFHWGRDGYFPDKNCVQNIPEDQILFEWFGEEKIIPKKDLFNFVKVQNKAHRTVSEIRFTELIFYQNFFSPSSVTPENSSGIPYLR